MYKGVKSNTYTRIYTFPVGPLKSFNLPLPRKGEFKDSDDWSETSDSPNLIKRLKLGLDTGLQKVIHDSQEKPLR
jgi:hypothetical protein